MPGATSSAADVRRSDAAPSAGSEGAGAEGAGAAGAGDDPPHAAQAIHARTRIATALIVRRSMSYLRQRVQATLATTIA
jgi:hypothetical protein